MMRPHLEWHDNPARLFEYMGRPGAEPLGGTLPLMNAQDMVSRLERLGDAAPGEKRWLHLTLSLPKGIRAAKDIWLRIIATTLDMLGIDPQATPWVTVRHPDQGCDHTHTDVVLNDFAGRPVSVTADARKSERIHQRLCQILGLPAPPYFDPDAGPRLNPITPARRLNNPPRRNLHTALTASFLDRQPESLEQLNADMADRPGGFQGEAAPNSHGASSIRWSNPATWIFGGELGEAWQPRFLFQRMQHCRALRRLRSELALRNLARLFTAPPTETALDQLINTLDAPRASRGQPDPAEPDHQHGQERENPPPASRSSEHPRGSTRELGGAPGLSYSPSLGQFPG